MLWGPSDRHKVAKGLARALQVPLGWVAASPDRGWGHPAWLVLSGMGRCCAGIQPQPCPQLLVHGRMRRCLFLSSAQLPCSSLCCLENFGLDWVPSLLLSCGQLLQRRVMVPGVKELPLIPSPPRTSRRDPPPKARTLPYHFSH